MADEKAAPEASAPEPVVEEADEAVASEDAPIEVAVPTAQEEFEALLARGVPRSRIAVTTNRFGEVVKVERV